MLLSVSMANPSLSASKLFLSLDWPFVTTTVTTNAKPIHPMNEQQRASIDEQFRASVMNQGFDLKVLKRFFSWMAKEEESIRKVVNIDGPVERGNIFTYDIGDDQLRWFLDRQNSFLKLCRVRSITHLIESTLFPIWIEMKYWTNELPPLPGDLELLINRQDPETDIGKIPAPDLLQATLNIIISRSENETEARDHLAICVKYWRGLLDSHRVTLHLAGNKDNSTELIEAHQFIKYFEVALKKKRKKSKK